MPDPTRGHDFQGRGLVVGYVQSGKTANYTALAARAADAGYRIVIILSGIHDSLRNQTQNRLERELTGHQEGGVGAADIGHEWVALTTPDTDFKTQDVRILQSPAPFLIVAKKHVKVLNKIDTWLKDAERYLKKMPVLVIDDEADQASINTGGNRDPALQDDDDIEDDDSAPSRTNSLIRSILSRAPKAAYVAYTATPFANVLVNPSALDREFGIDLFPKDFVVQLPRPTGYTGTEELFGITALQRDVLRVVPESDVKSLKVQGNPQRSRREILLKTQPERLPKSLVDAILTFCIFGAVRELRNKSAGKVLPAHTMLVHVSMRKNDQARIAGLVAEQIDLWRSAIEQGQSLDSMFANVWANERMGVDQPADDERIIDTSISVMRKLSVSVLNSDTGEELDYEKNPGRHVIAIGGNRLSRGLTLEGLTISYFLRTASMCDTLLQMARWYGFRLGYEDLIRIWTTDGIAAWFGELALVEQSMRDSIQSLELAGRRPDQMAIRIRAHSDLLLTARNKSAMATSEWDSWSGDHPQTVLFPLDEPSALLSNFQNTSQLISQLSLSTAAYGGRI
ncbi:MAG: Z1 domain-containing protein, partial [Planctomycetales bacterium]|nr:Z1 domain-containing protein [Planctomycetales bacterium]